VIAAPAAQERNHVVAVARRERLSRRPRVARDRRRALQFHLDSRIADLVRAGASPEAAEREARRRLGHPLLLRDRSRDIRLLPWFDALLQDVRLGLRVLVKHRIVTAAALASLTLALGGTIGAFSVVDALILRPLPGVGAPDELIYLTYRNDRPDPDGSEEGASFNYPLFLELRQAAQPSAQLFAVSFRWIQRPSSMTATARRNGSGRSGSPAARSTPCGCARRWAGCSPRETTQHQKRRRWP
jgi:hypothetical protein